MNVTEKQMKEYGFNQYFGFNEMVLKIIFGASESLFSFDTYQFKDYSKHTGNRHIPHPKYVRLVVTEKSFYGEIVYCAKLLCPLMWTKQSIARLETTTQPDTTLITSMKASIQYGKCL